MTRIDAAMYRTETIEMMAIAVATTVAKDTDGITG
jgi:hypothetical protein